MARPRSTICCECHERPRNGNLYRCDVCEPLHQAREYQKHFAKKKAASIIYNNKPGMHEIRALQKRIRLVGGKVATPENKAKYTRLVDELHALKQQYGVRETARSI